MRIHAEDCPALCQNKCTAYKIVNAVPSSLRWEGGATYHQDHICSCHAQGELDELIDAVLDRIMAFRSISPEHQLPYEERLEAAIEPFRKGIL